MQRATLTRYTEWLGTERDLRFEDYDSLWRWSVADIDAFWESLVEFFSVRFSLPAAAVLGSRTMPGAEWFPGARISYAEHIFRGKDDAEVAIRHASELRSLDSWTWGELRAQTAAIASGLRALGVGEGDRVVAYMPNIPETVAAFFACASIGAVWSSAAPEFGARSVIDRFAQVEPKVLLAVDGYRYGGRRSRRWSAWCDSATWTAAAGSTTSRGQTRRSSSRSCPLTTRCGCSTARGPPACPSRSSTARAGSCSSRSRT
jgi:acetoacetyl-CoA synthetase